MMTIVRTQEEAQSSDQEVATARDEFAREGTRRMILAALEVEVEEYRRQHRDVAMRWWRATGRPGRVA